MPWSSRKSRKLATQVSFALGFIASIPINLATSWFQQDIISNKFLSISVIIILAAICYLVIKMRAPRYLIVASMSFVAGIYVNLFSWWLQEDILHNSFTISNVFLILFITVLILVSGAFIGSHPISSLKSWLRRNYRKNARGRVRLAQYGRVNTRRRRQPNRQRNRRS